MTFVVTKSGIFTMKITQGRLLMFIGWPNGLFAAWEGPSLSSKPTLIRILLGNRDSPQPDPPNTRTGS